ncbi:MAG: hypothetical protein ACRYG7_07805 [Janthinobacterium lividum]
METALDRQIRDEARQKYVEDSLAQSDGAAPEVIRTIIALHFNKADQDDARAQSNTTEEMRLITEALEMHAGASWKIWDANLRKHYGEEIAAKLSNHQVEVGMTVAMVGASYGNVPEGGEYRNRENGRTVLVYGSGEDASYFEFSEEGIVTVAVSRGGWALPDFVYNFPGFTI